MIHNSIRLATLLLVLSIAPIASAKPPLAPLIPHHGWVLSNTTGGVWNPLGAENRFNIGYRYRLSDSDSILLRNTFVQAEALGWINPAFGRLGVAVTVQPLAILKIQARYLFRGYFGSFKQMQSFNSPRAAFDDTTRDQLGDAGQNYTTTGHEFALSTTLQGKFKSFALVARLDLHYFAADLRNGDTVFYDIAFDTVLPDNGWALKQNVQLLYFTPWRLVAGAWYVFTTAFYADSAYAAGEPRENANSHHKLGPMFAYTFASSKRMFQKPTVIASFQWYLKHRFRTGQDVNQAIPTGLIAFRFNGDF